MSDAAFPSRRGLTGDALKLLAILAMTLDHIAWLLFPGYPAQAMPLAMHIIGRLTCPIMCYFIAEGYHYTRNFRRYALRLFLLAIVSHFAYIYASNAYQDWRSFIPFYSGSVLNQTGVVWSLLGGLLMLRVNDLDCAVWKKAALILLLCLLTFPADWSCIAALCILSIGSNRGNPKKQLLWCAFYVSLYGAVYYFSLDRLYGVLQLCVFLSVPLLRLYNGARSKNAALSRVMKPLFYLYYPLHLFAHRSDPYLFPVLRLPSYVQTAEPTRALPFCFYVFQCCAPVNASRIREPAVTASSIVR